MKHLALALLLAATACSKKTDAPAAGGFADVDCDKMITHTVEVLLKDGLKGKSDTDMKQATDAMKGKHAEMVKACEDEKGTKKLTREQYDCLLAAPTMIDMKNCVVPK